MPWLTAIVEVVGDLAHGWGEPTGACLLCAPHTGSGMLMVARLVAAPDKRFHYEYWQRRHSGMLAGLRVATCRHASCNAHAA